MGERIDQLRAELAAAEEAEKEARVAKLEAVPVVMRYSVSRDTSAYVTNDLYDDAVVPYRVEGRVVNREAALAAGHESGSLDRRGGGMTWLFNTLSDKLVCDVGGGSVHFGFPGDVDEAHLKAVKDIAAFIAANPDGGDITGIIEEYRRTKKSRW